MRRWRSVIGIHLAAGRRRKSPSPSFIAIAAAIQRAAQESPARRTQEVPLPDPSRATAEQNQMEISKLLLVVALGAAAKIVFFLIGFSYRKVMEGQNDAAVKNR